jgi:alanyl-tRNA synthetase
MNSNEIRKAFFDFFASKGHVVIPSAPMVIRNDPSLMFTNAGMNQFKDIFLGNVPVVHSRIANTQKCLRVSGKHNDLEEVGHDTYHHTMFEMLGNWSFGDYFKEEAISWAWEFLVKVMGIPEERLYATVFEGNKEEKLEADFESFNIWKKFFSEKKIIYGTRKDNFWEMGDTGPCGPCSEVHIDIRNEEERRKTDGRELLNRGHSEVIEIWNLVFIQYNRKVNGILELLPKKHVDTGMGFERLCMAVQQKQSNYDADIFTGIINEISDMTGLEYGKTSNIDVAMRVVADHLRAISFSIADGQLPSNNKAGYVIRRILRRAVRYGYTYLNQPEPFIYRLVPVLAKIMGATFPELISQQELIEKVIHEEENTFLRTLENGIRRLNQTIAKIKVEGSLKISGKDTFELYDTYGFPFDLTELILKEQDLAADKNEFEEEMNKQKTRSREAGALSAGDWVIIRDSEEEEFTGYDRMEEVILIVRYRKIKTKRKELFQLVFDRTPFYSESGGQVGDTGSIRNDKEEIPVIDTKKENNLIIHITERLPADMYDKYTATVNAELRKSTMNNHTATHLLHYALRKISGQHIEQKGSFVDPEHLRFDFSHFRKLSGEELEQVESLVNSMIRKNIPLDEYRSLHIDKAKSMGAIALFGEKYSDTVRVIRFGDSVELCGGTHVQATGQIGYFKIVSESAIAAGIRRIEAITGEKAEKYLAGKLYLLKEIGIILKNPPDLKKSIENLISENTRLTRQIESLGSEKVKLLKQELIAGKQLVNGINVITGKIETGEVSFIKDLAFQIKPEVENLFLVLGAEVDAKAYLTVMISENLVSSMNLHAGNIISEIAREVNGSGGGQPFYATAGGKSPEGILKALEKAIDIIRGKKSQVP